MASTDPATHYVLTGARLGYEACSLFDGTWYAANYPDCLASGLSPMAHYVTLGARLGHDPHPLFDTNWYTSRNPTAGIGADALLHYLRVGAAAGAAPNPLFDPPGICRNTRLFGRQVSTRCSTSYKRALGRVANRTPCSTRIGTWQRTPKLRPAE